MKTEKKKQSLFEKKKAKKFPNQINTKWRSRKFEYVTKYVQKKL